MRCRRLLISTCLLAGLCGTGAPVALAANGGLSGAVSDCNRHLRLTEHYSVAQLRNALATMPADVREYTPCYGIIQNQLFKQIGQLPGGSGSASGGSGGSFISTPVLIVIIVIVVGGGAAAYIAYRRRPPV